MAASFLLFQDPLFSIVSEESGQFYISKYFVMLGCVALLLVRLLGPLLLMRSQIYRMRQVSSAPLVAGL